MNAKGSSELNGIKSELRSIIRELNQVSETLRSSNFAGIGTENCANTIDAVANKYEYVLRKLNNIDTSSLTESFVLAHQDEC